MEKPLTGRDAAEALGLCTRLADAGARFNRSALERALRTRQGRARVAAGFRLVAPHARMSLSRFLPRREPAGRRPRRRLRGVRAPSAPGRPSRPSGPAETGEAV